METVLPIIKNKSEIELQTRRGMFVDLVFDNPESPIVMYGEDVGGSISFSPSEGREADEAQKSAALENLRNIQISYSTQDFDGIKIAIIEHEYAAEKILDPSFLLGLSKDLESEEIAIGIPMKGIMIAAPKASARNVLGATINGYENSRTYPVSKSIFLVSGGEILAIS